MRDNLWLENQLHKIWQGYFRDIPKFNNVEISFGRKAKKRLASIRQKSARDSNSDTEIKVTGYYKNLEIPDFVVDATLAHELCHYAHGFASPLTQYSKYPHKGDVVDIELEKRGLGDTLKKQKLWLKKNWFSIINKDQKSIRKSKKTSALKNANKISIINLIRRFS